MRVLQVEFNELSPELIDQLMNRGELPNFRRIYESSEVFTTKTDARPPHLEPWVQWPTVHLGVSHETHGLLRLGASPYDTDVAAEAVKAPVAKVASEAGLRVGVFGSMNVPYQELNGFYMPDPWNAGAKANPTSLAPFQHTVGSMVRDSSSTEGVAGGGAGLAAFGSFLLRHGLTRATALMLVKQLAAERRDNGVRWRRASVLDWIQYDVFRNLATRGATDYGTFFSNSTAHYQHYFWRNMNPEGFDLAPSPEDHPSYADAIAFGYRSMDRILGRMLHDFPDAVLVLCTALSQQPWIDATKQTFRPISWPVLLELVGYSEQDVRIEPVMAEEFVATFADESAAADAKERFAKLKVDGTPLMKFSREGSSLVGGCAIYHAGVLDGRVEGAIDGSQPRLRDVFRPIHTVRSGRHSNEGALWFRTGHHVVHEGTVSLEDVAPTVLSLLGVDSPGHMTGQSLI